MAHALPIAAPTPLPQNAWSRVASPTRGEPKVIGFYSNGCIAGAHALPLDGEGYQIMKVSRNRYYGHPETIQFVEDLARNLEIMDSALLVSDMGQPRGGPMPYGHASHQVGLDVDIWFWDHPEQRYRSLSLDEREKLPMPSMLSENGIVDPHKFGPEQILKLQLASEDERVSRIFVNPAIKVYLCSTLETNERDWLHKLRPWPGHDSHFHVRLHCPKTSPDCVQQTPVADGDGCPEVIPPRGLSTETNDDIHHEEQNEWMTKILAPIPVACTKLLKAKSTGSTAHNLNPKH